MSIGMCFTYERHDSIWINCANNKIILAYRSNKMQQISNKFYHSPNPNFCLATSIYLRNFPRNGHMFSTHHLYLKYYVWKIGNWAGLAVLFSRQLPNSSRTFFSYFQYSFFFQFNQEPSNHNCPYIFDT